MIATPSNSVLLRHFREFYAEVVRRQEAVTRLSRPPALEPVAAESDEDAGAAAWHVLRALLAAQSEEAARLGGMLGARIYLEVQYVLVALADEIFLNADWEGRSRWPLLEASLFRTHSAGETVFDRIDRMLARPDYVYADVAAVYFWALSLGFEGKYRGSADRAPLAQYRAQLFQLLYRDRPRLYEAQRPLFPEAYLHNLEEGSGRRLPNPRLWLGVLALVLVLWVGLSQLAWVRVTSHLDPVLCHITGGCAGTPRSSP